MAVNHVSSHKYGDRKALGLYRMCATFVMLVLFSFLTVYDVLITKERFYFTLTWWVSLGTLLFFTLSMVGVEAYMGAKPPNPRLAEDGSHPFYLWKISLFVYSFWMQAGLHLALLMSLNTAVLEDREFLEQLLYIAPFLLLLGDWVINRIYMIGSIMIWYPLISYFMVAAYANII